MPEFYVSLQSIKLAMLYTNGICGLNEHINAFKGRRDKDNNVGSNTSREKEFRTENEVDTESVDSFDEASDDSWDSSDDYLSFENPSEVPLENHISCENNAIARLWIIPGFPSSLPPSRKDDMYKSVGYYHLRHAVENRRGTWFVAYIHTCWVDPDCNALRSLLYKVIGSFYAANQLEKSTAMTPTRIMQELKSNYGISIRYNQAVRSRQRDNDCIYANPQSYVRLQTDHEHRFKYVFYALRASINVFINYDRPVIVVDETYLKGNNSRLQPLSFSTCDGYRLREAYGCPIDLLIVSDQHKSIVHAMSTVYPDATHGLCYYHLQKKFVVYSKKMVDHFNRAAYAYRPLEYQRYNDPHSLFYFHSIPQSNPTLYSMSDLWTLSSVLDSDKIFKTLMNAKPE
ncbi:hypothetical protein ACS0TY_031927 [Phlomoides rotata]